MPTTHTVWIKYSFAVGVLYSFAAGTPLHAQNLQPLTTVHAAGEHSVDLKPQKLRVTITMHAEGTDAKTAVRSLAEHKARVKQDLVMLKADEDSIKFGATQVGSVTSGVMMPPVAVPSYSPVASPTFGPPVTANDTKLFRAVAMVTADWPLPTTDLDALALLPDALRAQVEAHDLRGEKNKAELSPEEQERREEMQIQSPIPYPDYYATQQVAVRFVTKIDPAARQEAIKVAFDKAATEADMLASAAGRKRGELVRLQCIDSSDMPFISYPAPVSISGASIVTQSTSDEVTADTPDALQFRIRVETDFELVK